MKNRSFYAFAVFFFSILGAWMMCLLAKSMVDGDISMTVGCSLALAACVAVVCKAKEEMDELEDE